MKHFYTLGLAVLLGLMLLTDRPHPAAGLEPPKAAADDRIVNTIGMKLKRIQAGKFLMGANDSGRKQEQPVHEVVLTRPFYIGVHEVTVGQFRQFVAATNYRTAAEKTNAEVTWQKPGQEQTVQHPVVCVTWTDAVAFCDWLSKKEGEKYALPTEAQWEYCCRAGTQTKYSFGDDDQELVNYAWINRNAGQKKKTQPVGQLRPNPWGLYDMHGNVREWCADYYRSDYYQKSPKEDPPGPGDSEPFNRARETRVIRGGSWFRTEGYCPSSFRLPHGNDQAGYASDAVGFRVVRLPADKRAQP
jgi:formylglycine-generating enzyme required for sulfatase activity